MIAHDIIFAHITCYYLISAISQFIIRLVHPKYHYSNDSSKVMGSDIH